MKDHNKIHSIFIREDYLSLISLSLNFNELRGYTIQHSIPLFRNLETLHVDGNRLTRLEDFNDLTSLRNLSADNNELQAT